VNGGVAEGVSSLSSSSSLCSSLWFTNHSFNLRHAVGTIQSILRRTVLNNIKHLADSPMITVFRSLYIL